MRFIAIFLLLANGLYFAWSSGQFSGLGLAPHNPSEPHRLTQQLQPQRLKILRRNTNLTDVSSNSSNIESPNSSATESTSKPSPQIASSTTNNQKDSDKPNADKGNSANQANAATPENKEACLMAGPLTHAQANAVKTAASAALSASQWALSPSHLPGRWIVYMGPYIDQESLNRSKSELRTKRIAFEPLSNPKLEPGLSLGSFDDETSAQSKLKSLETRGISLAKVMQESPNRQEMIFTLPKVDNNIKTRLEPIRASLGSQALRPCS